MNDEKKEPTFSFVYSLDLNEAEKLVEAFHDMVSDTFKESAKHSMQTIKWWLHTIYAKGYSIEKTEAKI